MVNGLNIIFDTKGQVTLFALAVTNIFVWVKKIMKILELTSKTNFMLLDSVKGNISSSIFRLKKSMEKIQIDTDSLRVVGERKELKKAPRPQKTNAELVNQ